MALDNLTVMHSFDNNTVLMILSRFEFEKHDDKIFISFDDYLNFPKHGNLNTMKLEIQSECIRFTDGFSAILYLFISDT